MQAGNGNVAAMDKRVDVGSLFCMIGRHGPAVAVAVIAVVSVLAGLIVYRNVKGKQRKAADGDAGGVPDAPMRQDQESNPRESRGRSPDVGKDVPSSLKEADLLQSHRSIRNRHTVVHKETLLYRPAEKASAHDDMHTSTLSQTSHSMMQPSSQDSDQTLKDDGMTAEEVASDEMRPSKPVIGGPHQDKSEVPKSHEDEILENVWDVKPSQEKVNSLMTGSSFSDHDTETSQETDQMLLDTKTSRERDSKEVATDADEVNLCKGPEVKRTTHNLECNVEELKNKSPEKFDRVTSSELEFGKVIEEDVAQDLNDNAAKVQNISPHQTQTGLGGSQEVGIRERVTPDKQNCGEAPIPLLLLQPTGLQSDNTGVVDPFNCLNQLRIGDERSSNWCKDTESVPLTGAKETQCEKNEGNANTSVHHWVSSSCKVPKETFCEEANTVIPSEMGCTAGSFEKQKSNQIPKEELPEVATGPSPIINADEASQIGFENSELTWFHGTGRESGTLSMTVSPYLQEANYGPPTENMALPGIDSHPSFREQTNAQNRLDSDEVAGEIRKDATFGACLSPRHIKDQTKLSANCMEPNVMDHFGEDEILTAELKQGENGEKTEAVKVDNVQTETSIMQATMETKWMTIDSEAHSQVNSSDPTVVNHVQTDHRGCSFLSEVEMPPGNQVKQSNTFYIVDGNGEKGKKVVAVQPMSQYVLVTFHIHYVTQSLHQKVAITGNQRELGNWKEFIPLEKSEDGHWATVVNLPAKSHVEWKFVVVDKGEVCRWEECGNRLLETGSGDDLLVHKWWGFL